MQTCTYTPHKVYETENINCCVFVHCMQMISLYRDPTGERVFSKSMPTSEHTQSSNGTKQHRLSEVGAV